MLQYHSAYYAIEDGWFMARVLDFPGVISQGKSIDHARKMIKDALCLMAEHKLESGESLPTPNPRVRQKGRSGGINQSKDPRERRGRKMKRRC